MTRNTNTRTGFFIHLLESPAFLPLSICAASMAGMIGATPGG